jgi:excisionase family DNA binding protein
MCPPLELQEIELKKETMSASMVIRDSNCSNDLQSDARISVNEIARRLSIGRQTVYSILDQGILPGIRLGQRWLITRHVYEQWERTCGMNIRGPSASGLPGHTEVRSD